MWMGDNGVICLSKSRRAKADKSMRLEDISRVERGASADNFSTSAQFSTAVAGAEQCCISIYGREGDASFHFRLGDVPSSADSKIRSTTAARMLCELFHALMGQLSAGTSAQRRARAANYARTGELNVSSEDRVDETVPKHGA